MTDRNINPCPPVRVTDRTVSGNNLDGKGANAQIESFRVRETLKDRPSPSKRDVGESDATAHARLTVLIDARVGVLCRV